VSNNHTLKKENLLLSKDRDIVITDFGFANRFDVETTDLMATSCGSPCYAAPELVISDDNQYVGTAVDIWSCGVILFAMLCGYLPFDDDPSNPQGANINLLYKYILNTPLELPKNMSPDAKDLLRRMLVPDPTKRCTMDVILNHPWLSEYSNLLCKSIHQLETEACENVLFWTPNHVVHSDSRYDSPVPTVPKEPEPRDASMPQHDSVTSDKKDQVPLLEQDENSSSSVLDSEKVETPPPPPSSTSTSKGDAPASFLQAKFFSTVQRHVSATSRRVPFTNQQSSSTPQHNRISSPFVRTKSTSVQPKARRDRTISETHSKKPQELSILPSVSEQTVISTANGKTSPFDKQNRTKGQKLMDWFKRKPSQSKIIYFFIYLFYLFVYT
jgi:serine/threonine protein kinase